MRVWTHPNGFIQIEDGTDHIHIWSSDIPRQAIPSPIHNHRFSFESTVVEGTLVNIRYGLVRFEAGAYRLFTPLQGPDGETTLVLAMDQRFDARIIRVDVLTKGDRYTMGVGEYHESRPHGFAITHMTKTFVDPNAPVRVLVPHQLEPDNTFRRLA